MWIWCCARKVFAISAQRLGLRDQELDKQNYTHKRKICLLCLVYILEPWPTPTQPLSEQGTCLSARSNGNGFPLHGSACSGDVLLENMPIVRRSSPSSHRPPVSSWHHHLRLTYWFLLAPFLRGPVHQHPKAGQVAETIKLAIDSRVWSHGWQNPSLSV